MPNLLKSFENSNQISKTQSIEEDESTKNNSADNNKIILMYAFKIMKVCVMALSLTYFFSCLFFYMSSNTKDFVIDDQSYYTNYKLEDKTVID